MEKGSGVINVTQVEKLNGVFFLLLYQRVSQQRSVIPISVKEVQGEIWIYIRAILLQDYAVPI